MTRGFFNVPKAVNEPVKGYAPGSPEREELLETYKSMFHSNFLYSVHHFHSYFVHIVVQHSYHYILAVVVVFAY